MALKLCFCAFVTTHVFIVTINTFLYILFPWLIYSPPPFFFLQSLHHELSLYVQQLKIDIEKGKLSDNILKLEKQINKEKKLIRRGRTKGLIKEHEVQ